MVQVPVGRLGGLEGVHADVVKRLVVDTESLVRVFHELVDGQGGVVRLNHRVGNLNEGRSDHD